MSQSAYALANVDFSDIDLSLNDIIRRLWANSHVGFYGMRCFKDLPTDEEIEKGSNWGDIDYLCGRALKINVKMFDETHHINGYFYEPNAYKSMQEVHDEMLKEAKVEFDTAAK